MKRAIEEDFPIVEINRLAVPERNSFKPIYQMHKWFARRASCVFRAILLAALKPAGTNIMEEFYKDHSRDPDTNGKVVLDPFMGGGTTVVEALRLGCKVVGIDLNPIAWFIVKTEVEPVDLVELDAAFDRLANRLVPWSGQPLRQTLLDLFKTSPPWTSEEVCGMPNSDIIYTFWVKSAICTSPTCRKQVPLFSDYILTTKTPSVRYYPDCKCPKCDAEFDWEIEPAALIPNPRLMFHGNIYSGGVGRSSARWTYAHEEGGIFVCQGKSILKKDGKVKEDSPEWIHVSRQCQVKTGTLDAGHVCCPACNEIVRPRLTTKKKKRKKVPLTILLCPQTEDVFQWRGELADGALVTSPAGHTFDPHKGNSREKGRFLCPHCGNNDSVIESIRSLPADQPLPIHAYGLQSYSPACSPAGDPAKNEGGVGDLFRDVGEKDETETDEDEGIADVAYSGPHVPPTKNLIWKQNGKFYGRHAPSDQARFQEAESLWAKHHASLPYPKSEIPSGQETDRLHEHHYRHWHQMFTPRQLLCMATLLAAIGEEANRSLRELLLSAYILSINSNNTFTRYHRFSYREGKVEGIFSRHDFQPKTTTCEINVWGAVPTYGPFISNFAKVVLGMKFATRPYDFGQPGGLQNGFRDPVANGAGFDLRAGDSREEISALSVRPEVVITDPPYAGNVNYSELADFFYVWLRLLLKNDYPTFNPEHCPKIQEIVENASRGLDGEAFKTGLREVLRKASDSCPNGLVVFTYHHSGDQQWSDLLEAICEADLVVEAIYPVHSESENSMHLQNNESIAYDLIHVCRKRRPEDTRAKRSWAGLRQLVRQRAREEVARIEGGRYGGQPLPPPDVRMVLIGKCLEVYSRHYGAVVDWNGEPFPLKSALQDIRMMVEQIVSRETPLPSELENTDAFTQVWLLALCDKREVSVDSISKLTRGVFEVSDLTGHKPPLLRKGRVKGGRTYEVLTPLERLDALRQTLRGAESSAEQLTLLTSADNAPIVIGPELVDVIHLLAGNAEQGERLDQIVERFRGQREQIRAALQYLKQRDPDRWAKACDKLLPYYDDLFAQAALTREGK